MNTDRGRKIKAGRKNKRSESENHCGNTGTVVYTGKNCKEVFEHSEGKRLETLILGENKSLDEVRYDLNLVKTVPDTGIEVSWELSDYQTVNILGELQDKNLSEEGRIIELKALLTYGDAKAEHQFGKSVSAKAG